MKDRFNNEMQAKSAEFELWRQNQVSISNYLSKNLTFFVQTERYRSLEEDHLDTRAELAKTKEMLEKAQKKCGHLGELLMKEKVMYFVVLF